MPVLRDLLRHDPSPLDPLTVTIDHLFSLYPGRSGAILSPRPPQPDGVSVLGESRRARLRGRLVEVWLALWSARQETDVTLSHLVEAAGVSADYRDVVEDVARLDADSRARLTADVRSHLVVLRETLGSLPPRLQVDLAVRRRLWLAGDRGELRVRIDAVLSLPTRRVLLDVTTSPLGEEVESLALVALADLAVGQRPSRIARISTANGDVRALDVNDQLVDLAITTLQSRLEAA